MQKKNPKTRCERRTLSKAEGVCRFYSREQSEYASELELDRSIKEIKVNVPLDDDSDGSGYTTDFLCRKSDDTYMVRECVVRDRLAWPSVTRLLDISHQYWLARGIDDWGIVIERRKTVLWYCGGTLRGTFICNTELNINKKYQSTTLY